MTFKHTLLARCTRGGNFRTVYSEDKMGSLFLLRKAQLFVMIIVRVIHQQENGGTVFVLSYLTKREPVFVLILFPTT